MARPLKDAVPRDSRITVRINKDLKLAYEAVSSKTFLTVNDLIIKAMNEYLEKVNDTSSPENLKQADQEALLSS